MRIRYSGLLLGLLVATVIAALGYLGLLADLAHSRSVRIAAHRRSERALQALSLPHGVVVAMGGLAGGVRFGCTPDPDTSCLHAATLPNHVGPLLKRLLTVTHDDCGAWAGGLVCQADGRIAGQAALAIVYPHLYVTPSGRMPAGAVRGPGRHTYYRGSDIVLGLTQR